MTKTALFGYHNREMLVSHKRLAEAFDFQVDTASTLDEMLERVKERKYQLYIMDANLDSPDTPTIDPAVQVYHLIKDRVKEGSAVFVGITANRRALEIGEEYGINIQDKLGFNLTKYLE